MLLWEKNEWLYYWWRDRWDSDTSLLRSAYGDDSVTSWQRLQPNLWVVRQSLPGDHRSDASQPASALREDAGRPTGTQSLTIPRGRPLAPPRTTSPRTTARWIIQRQSMWITWCQASTPDWISHSYRDDPSVLCFLVECTVISRNLTF